MVRFVVRHGDGVYEIPKSIKPDKALAVVEELGRRGHFVIPFGFEVSYADRGEVDRLPTGLPDEPDRSRAFVGNPRRFVVASSHQSLRRLLPEEVSDGVRS